MERLLTMIMAGGIGERLRPLTLDRAKSAVPFGGKFRLIDIVLSNCINSGLRRIFVLTQYRSGSLNRHIQEGWGISSSRLGDFIYCVPAQQQLGAEWYLGTADAVRQNVNLLQGNDIDNVLILSGDHIYKMNYLEMLAYHRSTNSDLTVAAVRARKEVAAHSLGVLEADKQYRMVGFEEKPAHPKTIPGAPDYALASMGVYLFKVNALFNALRESGNDFGKEVIPRMLHGGLNIHIYDYEKENKIEDYIVEVVDGKRRKILTERTRDSSYWRDVGTIDSYYEASMDLIGIDPVFNLYGEKWPLRTYQRPLPPSKCVLGGTTPESIVSDGCIISGGTIWSTILSPGVIVEKNAFVESSIIFDDVIIEPNVKIKRAIIDKGTRIQAGSLIGFDHNMDKQRGYTISEKGITVIAKGLDIGQGVQPLMPI
ncbi:MAG: glucose-1-phosphate adenylyltransferase [Chloroflexi bacterium]|nr:glucose-1-phosphate adenylyltransferase [Chloroflexota bacterium]